MIKKTYREFLKKIINKLPYVRTLIKTNSNSKFPAGHYYSTVVSLEEIIQTQDEIWKKEISEKIEGISLNTTAQLELLENISTYYSEMPFKDGVQDNLRYYLDNTFYSYTDGIVLYLILRHFQPEKVIEIGSGFSSAVLLDTRELFLDPEIEYTFIEPYPEERLNSLMDDRENGKVDLISQRVQSVPLSTFEQLGKGDILFIDSTHAVKTGSDVNYILFDILPILTSGVLIHFHDIHYPFEYPKEWVLNGFGWNETYFLRAFMLYNKDFSILLFTDFLQKFYPEIFIGMPLCKKGTGSSFWIVKN